jgi:hypothetical protein
MEFVCSDRVPYQWVGKAFGDPHISPVKQFYDSKRVKGRLLNRNISRNCCDSRNLQFRRLESQN